MSNLLVVLTMTGTAYGQVPPGFTLTELASGLSRPANLQALPDGRFLIGEQQTGQIKVYKSGSILSNPYAIISPLYTGNNESGLLGLCLDPDFSSNGYVYAFVTHDSTTSRFWPFTTSGDVGTNQTLIVDNIPHRGVNHNGGRIGFGTDGKLYIGVGEDGVSHLRPHEIFFLTAVGMGEVDVNEGLHSPAVHTLFSDSASKTSFSDSTFAAPITVVGPVGAAPRAAGAPPPTPPPPALLLEDEEEIF